MLFLIVISPQVIADGVPGFTHSALGAGGMFIAIVTGLLTGAVMSLFARFTFFKDESVIPDFVRAWFDAMLPIGLVVVVGWLLIDIAGFDLYNVILTVFLPLQGIVESPLGFALMGFVICFFYSMGISTWVFTPIFTPVLLAAMQANMDGTAVNLVTNATLYSAYLWIGGVGITAPLVIMMLFARAKRLKALARASVVPTVFNINEPIIFGAIAWNPILMVPLWIQGAVLPLLVWLFTKTIPFAPIPMYQFELWYTPFPISTWLTTASLAGLALFAMVAAVATTIWYPFFRAYDRQVQADEVRVESEEQERDVNV